MDTNQNTGTAITRFYIEFSWMDPDLQQKEFGSATLLPFSNSSSHLVKYPGLKITRASGLFKPQ
jgi:hypothetical protein